MEEKEGLGLPICDWYARIQEPKTMLKNITDLFRSSENDRMLCLYYGDEKYIPKNISDFEYFAELCRLLPQIDGTLTGELLWESFEMVLGIQREDGLSFDDDTIAELWWQGNAWLSEINGDYRYLLLENCVEFCQTSSLHIGEMRRVEKYNNEEYITVLADLRGLPFVRPDPYHAHVAEEKLANGDALTPREESCLCHELLYLFATDGSVVPTVHLRADGDGKTAGELIDYLRRRALACRILLAADDQMSAETVAALCAMSGDGVTVRPEIVIGDSDSRRNLYARLCRLSALYPMSRWRFGGRATDSLLFFAAHRHFERVMNRLLHEEESK